MLGEGRIDLSERGADAAFGGDDAALVRHHRALFVPVQVTVVLSAGVAGEQPSASARSLAAKGAINGASAMAYRSIK